MAIVSKREGDVHILKIDGDITIGGGRIGRTVDLQGRRVNDLGAKLRELLKCGQSRIVLDLSAVAFIDSAGFGELVAYKKRAREREGDVKIVQPSRRVKELFSMTKLDSVFELLDDERAAIESF